MSPVAPKAIVIYLGLDPLTLVKPVSPVAPPAIAVLMAPLQMQSATKEMTVWIVFSGFLDPGGRFVITTESVHCPHLPGFV